MLLSLAGALASILVILLLLTGSCHTSLIVVFCLGLVDLNLIAVLWLWGLELNFITMVNLILAVGLAVDYSAHIAHAYNTTLASGPGSNREKRVFKVKAAFSKIGPSVLHGAMSTFLAILTISASSSYVFQAFFKQVRS